MSSCFRGMKKDDKFDVEGNTTCPVELLKIIHEYFQTCFPGSNPKIKYDNTSHLSQVAGYWAGQKKLVLKYGEARYAQLGMGAWRQTDIYSRFLDFTADIVGKTVHAFPQYAAPPYTQFKPNEWNVTEEMGIGCWAQESYKTIKKEKKRVY
ncbi:hypothetical protein TYRP_013650 [Tyrophagus putrescentiae]|nr:hypothetical protein TYRP_013650 [Tyrophagus putrescentiae]